MENKYLIGINRADKFFSENDFLFEDQLSREAFEGDGNYVIVLYRVDRTKTQYNDLYGESSVDGIKYFSPIELRVVPTLAEPENKTYNEDSGTLRYLQDGQFTFEIFVSHLREMNVDINVGDYVAYGVTEKETRFFTVTNDGKKNYDNVHTIVGYKGLTRTVICAPTDDNEFLSK